MKGFWLAGTRAREGEGRVVGTGQEGGLLSKKQKEAESASEARKPAGGTDRD